VAGSFAIPIPPGVIQSIQVFNTPDSFRIRRIFRRIDENRTKGPPAAWRYKIYDFVPAFRAKNGDLVGLANMTPRFEFGGPMVQNKYSFSENLT